MDTQIAVHVQFYKAVGEYLRSLGVRVDTLTTIPFNDENYLKFLPPILSRTKTDIVIGRQSETMIVYLACTGLIVVKKDLLNALKKQFQADFMHFEQPPVVLIRMRKLTRAELAI